MIDSVAGETWLTYYHLEQYLFGGVRQRFTEKETVTPFDFFCIVIWKANRAKSKIARLLLKHRKPLDAAVAQLVKDIQSAKTNEAKMRVLLVDWELQPARGLGDSHRLVSDRVLGL